MNNKDKTRLVGNLEVLREELRSKVKEGKKEGLMRFFKTGKGEYGEGDKFLGVMVPQTRELVKRYKILLGWQEVDSLVNSEYHEERLLGLLILVEWYKAGGEKEKKKVFEYYLENYRQVNNWDLVDLTAPNIVGDYLDIAEKRGEVIKLVKSDSLWKKRIGVLSCAAFIKRGSCEEIFQVADILMKDNHDLIQKAVGWMLRESGKKCGEEKLELFLRERYKVMPRTMLRYSIERFSDEKRKKYLGGNW
ncbi:MAG: hypothetical protein UW68_C0038G0004 [Candidatus Collierbacteria bacterium GW2011_GWB1_44_6]|uniref:DNA alkylation repair protein n=1 Tax=Candidatus Collierbacteria bacterium GW2011_GWB1_44_6 TaxID=1618384 RepID=A0A0G1MK74_9BACT|nr:MAG: hypothetical protein UW68_C0038G0004 [Candidatus Collierbacteria bacterium GW2011_GWB1_44_6]